MDRSKLGGVPFERINCWKVESADSFFSLEALIQHTVFYCESRIVGSHGRLGFMFIQFGVKRCSLRTSHLLLCLLFDRFQRPRSVLERLFI